MNAEGQHERQRIGQAKCQRVDQRTPAITCGIAAGGNSVLDDAASRLIVDTRKIKKERNCLEGANENGNDHANDATVAGSSENGHQAGRACRTVSNGFHARDLLQEVIAAKLGQTVPGVENSTKNDKLRLMIEDSLRSVGRIKHTKNTIHMICV